MNCKQTRQRLLDDVTDETVRTHLDGCEDCARFAEHWTRMRAGLQERHAGVTPDGSFVARVRERIDHEAPSDALGWAAVRLLPVSLVLLAVLFWFSLDRTPAGVADDETWISAVDDPLSWVVGSEDRR